MQLYITANIVHYRQVPIPNLLPIHCSQTVVFSKGLEITHSLSFSLKSLSIYLELTTQAKLYKYLSTEN